MPTSGRPGYATGTTRTASSLSKEEDQVREDFGFSPTEFERYKDLNIFNQTNIIALLKERKNLNQFVSHYLEEKITPNRLFSTFFQLLLPTEHSLLYALKKVDEIEEKINLHLDPTSPLFDKDTTKKNRLNILLAVAKDYRNTLINAVNTTGETPVILQKLHDLDMLIQEFEEQIKTSTFMLHNPAIRAINDPDLNFFLNKLQAIGISGFTQKSLAKDQTTFFMVKIVSALYEKIYPKKEDDLDSDDQPRP